MQTRTIPLRPILGSRPSYGQVAKYQQDKADLKTLDTLVSGVRKEMETFQKLDGGRHDLHPEPHNIAVNRPNFLKTKGAALVAGAGLMGLLTVTGLGGLQQAATMIGLAVLSSPLLIAPSIVLTGVNPLLMPFMRETGELESKDGQVIRFWREISDHHSTNYSRDAEMERYVRGKDTAEVHHSALGPEFAIVENLEHSAYAADLDFPTVNPNRGTTIPLQGTQTGPWLSDRKQQKAFDACRREAEKLVDRVKSEAEKLAKLDDGPQDFRPGEPGHLIVCTPRMQGELQANADGKTISYVQQNVDGRRGFLVEGQRETYYDRGGHVIIDRAKGTLNFANKPLYVGL